MRRFEHSPGGCHFCDLAGADGQAHYMACAVSRDWMAKRLCLRAQPGDAGLHAWLFSMLDWAESVATCAVFACDAVWFAVGHRRRGPASKPHSWVDGRPKVLRRRHKTVRAIAVSSKLGRQTPGVGGRHPRAHRASQVSAGQGSASTIRSVLRTVCYGWPTPLAFSGTLSTTSPWL